MKARRQIVWHQGLFLTPQHLQVQDLVNQALLTPLYRFALPFFWGVAELELDEGGLREGALVLTKGSFLFQDGSYAVLGANAVVEGRRLEGAWSGADPCATVYLGLRRWDDGGANVSFPAGGSLAGAATRLVACDEPEEVCDLHGKGPAARVQRQNFLLRLFFETERARQGDYHLMPLARVLRTGEGARLDEEFVPPLVAAHASPWLGSTVASIAKLLALRLAELRRRGAHRGPGSPLDREELPQAMARHAVSSSLPLIASLADSPATHPWQLYLALSRLVGELASFSRNPPDAGEGRSVPPYDHSDLSRSFRFARDAIASLLDEVLAAPEEVVPLVREGECFTADLDHALFRKGNRYFLSLRSEADPALVLRAVHSTVKASTRDHLKVLSARALPGIGLAHLPVTPPGVVPRLNTLYLEVDQQNAQWPMVRSQQNLALYWHDAPQDLAVELVVLRGDTRG